MFDVYQTIYKYLSPILICVKRSVRYKPKRLINRFTVYTMSTTYKTIIDDMKTSLRQAYGSVLSYFLANLGMIIVVALLAIAIAIPVAIVAFVALSPFNEASFAAMSAWATANPLVIGGVAILFLIPVVSLFLGTRWTGCSSTLHFPTNAAARAPAGSAPGRTRPGRHRPAAATR